MQQNAYQHVGLQMERMWYENRASAIMLELEKESTEQMFRLQIMNFLCRYNKQYLPHITFTYCLSCNPQVNAVEVGKTELFPYPLNLQRKRIKVWEH